MEQTHGVQINPKTGLSLAVFLLIVIGVGATIGTLTAPGEWYASLDKPFFNPPNWIFAPVWFVLYVFIAIAGWRIWEEAPKSLPMKLWGAQMLLNWLWSPVFFSAEMLWAAVALILAVLAAIIGFIVTTWRRDRIASVLFMPYAAWVSFASILNLSIAWLN